MIIAENIIKRFDEQEVLKGVSMEFLPGKTNLIIGRSGAGKTVFLKILVGLMEPSSGKVWYDKVDFFSLNKKQAREIRLTVGMLFQGSALFDSMRVEENVRFPLDMFTNLSLAEKNKRVDFCLERVGLTGAHKKYPSEVSGGMQKRVGIARAIVMEPKYLFCDEPNSGLDPRTALLIDELIQDLTYENNMTTIINTHDMNSVMEIGDNIAYLHEGRLAWQGSKDQVLSSDNELLQGFIFASPFLQRLRAAALKTS
ncbi:MAG: ATP-binding cassette domain-containing protein [Saprospiraceae bacterium]|jgi:phospholipid/cholesterol/gamma-HCH transport system ATP-binding protein|nr:ATP-binding cassette domain-containing protein [Saprospiraceae bacterium]